MLMSSAVCSQLGTVFTWGIGGDHGRGSPVTDSFVINTDSQVLTLHSAKPSLLHDQGDTRKLTSLYLHGLLVAWMVSQYPGRAMCGLDVELDCCTEGCTSWGDTIIFWGRYSSAWSLPVLHWRVLFCQVMLRSDRGSYSSSQSLLFLVHLPWILNFFFFFVMLVTLCSLGLSYVIQKDLLWSEV